jgi:hypothetical protein
MDDYEIFVQQKLNAGESIELITSRIENALLPLKDRCAFCGSKATLACDYILGWTNMLEVKRPNEKPHWVFNTKESTPLTCDTTLCPSCAVHRGMTFACGQDGYVETEDWCPDHTGDGTKAVPMTEPEAEALRKRRRMRLLASSEKLKSIAKHQEKP